MLSKRRALLALILLLAFSYMISSVSATNESEEIDYIVDHGDGSRVIYYKDGHTDVIIKSSIGVNFESSATTWTTTIPSTSPLIDWPTIFDFIKNTVSTIMSALTSIAPLASNLAKWIIRKIRSIYKRRPLPRV